MSLSMSANTFIAIITLRLIIACHTYRSAPESERLATVVHVLRSLTMPLQTNAQRRDPSKCTTKTAQHVRFDTSLHHSDHAGQSGTRAPHGMAYIACG